MFFISRMRIALALLAGVVIMLCVSALTFLSTFTPLPLTQGPWLFAWLSRHLSHGLIGGIRYKIHGEIPYIEDGEIVVIYGNHQSTAGLSEFSYFVEHILGRQSVYVVKHDLYPWILWPTDRLGMAVKINREKGEEAKRAIKDALPRLIAERRVIVIFPDSSRWTSKRADDQRKEYGHFPGASELLEHVLMPKPGGFFQILDALEGHPYRLIEVGNEFDRRIEGLKEALALSGATFHLFVTEVQSSQIPKGNSARRDWLNRRFLHIARRLAEVRGKALRTSTSLTDVA